MATPMSEEAEDLHTIFIDNDWINTGKVYNSTTPSYMVLEKNKQMIGPFIPNSSDRPLFENRWKEWKTLPCL